MLQPATVLEPHKAAPLSLLSADDIDLRTAPLARMSVSRITLDVSGAQRTGLLRDCSAATELSKQESGMSVNTGANSKRSYIEGSCKEESVQDIEWEGLTRGHKRREASLERESRPIRYRELDHHHHLHHHQLHSGGSDLTTEQSVICMAVDGSNSTRSTNSLTEDACLLKLHTAASQASDYGDLARPDADEFDHSSIVACSNVMQASPACEAHNAHAACAGPSQYPPHIEAGHWLLASASHDLRSFSVCANHADYQIQKDSIDDHDVEVESDWLELRLGRNDICGNGFSGTSRCCSPQTLQLLPQEPDCAGMKHTEKIRELKLCGDENCETKALTNFEWVQLLGSVQARPPLLSVQSHLDQPGNLRENNQEPYLNLMKAGCPPMPPADCTIGQYITSRGLLPVHYTPNAVERVCNSRISVLDHDSTSIQQSLQDSNIHCAPPLSNDNVLQSRAAFHGMSQRQTSFKTMVCSSLQHEGMAGSPSSRRLPLLDFSQHYNWDLLASSTSSLSSPSYSCSLLQPAATSYRDLVASSFSKESLNGLDYAAAGALTQKVSKPASLYNGDALNNQMMWSCSRMQESSSSFAMAHHERVSTTMDMENGHNGSKSMSQWLSEALSGTGFDNHLNHRGLDDGELNKQTINAATYTMQKVNHGSKSKAQPPLKLVTRGQPVSRGSPGFWFALQCSTPETESSSSDGAGEALQSKTSYVRLRDGNVPLSVVKKFVMAKLGLSQESQVGFTCRGKLLDETTHLQSVHDNIWIPPPFVPNEALNFKSTSTSNIPKDHIMILTYQIISNKT